MDLDSAGFVLDRVDLAREAILEAMQVIQKFSQPEDEEINDLLQQLLDTVGQIDAKVRSGSYPTS